MKVNKEQMQKLANKSDSELWQEIVSMAKSHGYTLPKEAPSSENIEKIRRAMLGYEKISLTDAAKILGTYKKHK